MVDALLSVASQLAEEDGEDFQTLVKTPLKTTSSSGSIRQCEFCKSTETPAWRRGPAGKGSLCNACGIKWRLKKKVKKNDDGRADLGKKHPGARKTVGRPPKKHPKFIESKKFFCKSCNLPTDQRDFDQFDMICRNCSKRREERRNYHARNYEENVTIDHDSYRPPTNPRPHLSQQRESFPPIKNELLIQQELGEHEEHLASLRVNASRELNELKAHAISRIREFERLRVAQMNAMVGSLIANISACEQFQQEMIGRARHL